MTKAIVDGPPMPPHIFKGNLAKFFGVYLSPKQLGALMAHFDDDGDGTVDGTEFVNEIYRLWGAYESEKMQVRRRERRARSACSKHVAKARCQSTLPKQATSNPPPPSLPQKMAAERKEFEDKFTKEKEDKEEAAALLLTSLELCEFAPQDCLSAMLKLRTAAYMFDSRVNISLEAFQGPPMSAYQFRDLLRRVLKVNVNQREVSALIDYFDEDGDKTVSGGEFISAFFELRRDEQHKKTVDNQKRVKVRKERLAKVKKGNNIGLQTDADVLCDFDRKDLEHGMDKLQTAALNFNKRSQTLGGFLTGGAMGAVEFKAELRKALNVKLSNRELSAVFDAWDSDGQKSIDSQEFLARFYKFRS